MIDSLFNLRSHLLKRRAIGHSCFGPESRSFAKVAKALDKSSSASMVTDSEPDFGTSAKTNKPSQFHMICLSFIAKSAPLATRSSPE